MSARVVNETKARCTVPDHSIPTIPIGYGQPHWETYEQPSSRSHIPLGAWFAIMALRWRERLEWTRLKQAFLKLLPEAHANLTRRDVSTSDEIIIAPRDKNSPSRFSGPLFKVGTKFISRHDIVLGQWMRVGHFKMHSYHRQSGFQATPRYSLAGVQKPH